jgi:hypothetical protein
MKKVVHIWLQHSVVLTLAVIVGLSFGLCYGLGNHNTYLLHPFRELDPEFLQYDWLAAQTTAYHQNFALLIWLLAALGPLPWSVAIANVLLIATMMWVLYSFLIAYFGRDALVAILLLMSFVLLEKTRSVASSHILTSVLEPSSIAAVAVITGLLLLIAEHYLWSGIFVAIGGFFHTNFLLLDFIFFTCTHIVLGRKGIIRRIALQFAPSLLALLHELPMLYIMASDPLGSDARYAFQFIRSPHHYVPLAYLREFIPFAGWHLLAFSCLGLKNGDSKIASRLARVYWVFLGLVIAATLLTTLVYVSFVSQLFFWRMAPFSILLAQLIIVTRIVPIVQCSTQNRRLRAEYWQWTLAAVGGGLILTHHTLGAKPTEVGLFQVDEVFAMIEIVAVLTFVILTWVNVVRYLAVIPPASLAFGLVLAGLVFSAAPAYKASNVLHGLSAPKRELYQWVSSTAPDSQFLIPPGLKTFRLHTGRAVVVDWKSTPIKPSELIEWYRRIGRVSGNFRVKNLKEAEMGYAMINQQRLSSLVKEFGVNYAVFKKPFDSTRVSGKEVFSNSKFLVIKVR